MAGDLCIDVMRLTGENMASFVMTRDSLVEDLKENIEKGHGWPMAQQKLLLDSTIDLCPNKKPLGEFAGDREQFMVLALEIFTEEVYFLGFAYNDFHRAVGISDTHCSGAGEQLNNRNNGARFKKIQLGDAFQFESVTHPGLCMCVKNGTGAWDHIVLATPGDDDKHLFTEHPAWNGDSAKVSLESVASPGNFIAHAHGHIHVRGNDGNPYFKNDASWQIVEPSRDE